MSNPDRIGESRCGVQQSARELIEELKVEWRRAASTDEEFYNYNTRKMTCDSKGVLKVWIRTEGIGYGETRAMTRYEINCRNNQTRIMSMVKYDSGGGVTSNRSWKNPDWDEVIPDSVGEAILETVCRKSV
jgi:hypothetical protein